MPVEIETQVGAMLIKASAETLEQAIEMLGCTGEVAGHAREGSVFRHRHTSGYDFYELYDPATKEFMKLGQRKDGGLYPKGEWERWEGKREDSQPSRSYQSDPMDDIPF